MNSNIKDTLDMITNDCESIEIRLTPTTEK